jgi:hypothetical protein
MPKMKIGLKTEKDIRKIEDQNEFSFITIHCGVAARRA